MRILGLAALAFICTVSRAYGYGAGLEPGRIDVTQANASNSNVYRIWATDEGDVVSRYDAPLASGGGVWTRHGNGGSLAGIDGIAATSYFSGSSAYEYVFYFGTDNNLYVGTSIDRSTITWQAYAPPSGVWFTTRTVATSYLSGGNRYLIFASVGSDNKLYRWVRLASGGTATWTGNNTYTWVAAYLSITKNANESIVSIFAPAHNGGVNDLAMLRGTGSTFTTTNIGHPSGYNVSETAAIQGTFVPNGATYQVSVAAITSSTTAHIAYATSDTSTSFTWTPAISLGSNPVVSGQVLAGTVRGQTALKNIHEFFVELSTSSIFRIGVSAGAASGADWGPVHNVDTIQPGIAVAPRAGASRIFYQALIGEGTRLYERRGANSNLASDYRWLGSEEEVQPWLVSQRGAEAKAASWLGVEALGIMDRPGTGGSTDWPSVQLAYNTNQNSVLNPSKTKTVTKDLTIGGTNVHHNFVGDPTVVVDDDGVAYSLQLGQVMSTCTSGATITRSTAYIVSTTDGSNHSPPVIIATATGSTSDPPIDHPWADIQHRIGQDSIHIAWWNTVSDSIEYVIYQPSGLGTTHLLKTGGAAPPRVTVSDSGRAIVYYGNSSGHVLMCELNSTYSACTTPPGSSGGWTDLGSYYYHHNVPASGTAFIRSWYPVSMTLSETDDTKLHYCFEVHETSPSVSSDVRCGTFSRNSADGSWSLLNSSIVNTTADDGKDQFLPEIAVTSEDDSFASQDTVFATWYDRANSASNYTYQVMKAVSLNGGTTFSAPLTNFGSTPSDPEYLPRHCLNSNVRFLGDYAAVEGDGFHKNMPFVMVPPGTSTIASWVYTFAVGLGAWGG